MSPKVLVVVDHLDTGGAPVAVCNLIKGLGGLGASVTLMVLSEKVRHVLPSDVKIIMVGYSGSDLLGKMRRYSRHAALFDEAVISNDLEDIDLVLAHLHVSHQVVSRSVFQIGHGTVCILIQGSSIWAIRKGFQKRLSIVRSCASMGVRK